MTEMQLAAYRAMHTALGKALDEIISPGFNRQMFGTDLVSEIKATQQQAYEAARNEILGWT